MTQGYILPVPKPKERDPCNGCGACCIAIPCALAQHYLNQRSGKCRALEFKDGRFWCGMVLHPSKYIGTPVANDAELGAVARAGLGDGSCDARDSIVRFL